MPHQLVQITEHPASALLEGLSYGLAVEPAAHRPLIAQTEYKPDVDIVYNLDIVYITLMLH